MQDAETFSDGLDQNLLVVIVFAWTVSLFFGGATLVGWGQVVGRGEQFLVLVASLTLSFGRLLSIVESSRNISVVNRLHRHIHRLPIVIIPRMSFQVMRRHSNRSNRLMRKVSQPRTMILQRVNVEEGITHAQIRLSRCLLRGSNQLWILPADFLWFHLLKQTAGSEVFRGETHLLHWFRDRHWIVHLVWRAHGKTTGPTGTPPHVPLIQHAADFFQTLRPIDHSVIVFVTSFTFYCSSAMEATTNLCLGRVWPLWWEMVSVDWYVKASFLLGGLGAAKVWPRLRWCVITAMLLRRQSPLLLL